MKLLHATKHIIVVKDGKHAHAKIDFLLSNVAGKEMGYPLYPSANQAPRHRRTLKAIRLMCACAVGAHLTPAESVQAIRQCIVPIFENALKTI